MSRKDSIQKFDTVLILFKHTTTASETQQCWPWVWKGPRWRHQRETFPRYWPFVRGIHRSPGKSPHKGQWRWALMFSLICARINGWVNNGEAGDLRRNRVHYDVIVLLMLLEELKLFVSVHWSTRQSFLKCFSKLETQVSDCVNVMEKC